MAIITTSPIVSEIRGSVGTQTFSKNHYRAYVKTRKAPTQSASLYASLARSNMSDATSFWFGETEATKQAWVDFAPYFFAHNRLGKASRLSGFNAYIRAWMHILYAGSPSNPEPIPCGHAPRIISFTSTFLHTGLAVTLTLDRIDSRFYYYIQTSDYASPGKMSNNSVAFYNCKGGPLTGTTMSPSISSNFNARFPGLSGNAGLKLFLKVYMIDTHNGVAFPPVYVSGVIV
jgi:hypothetical protein